MERDGLAHPLLSFGWAVWVDIHALWHLWVSLACHHPAGVVKLVAAVINSNNVNQQDIFCCFMQPFYSHFERWKHPPVTENYISKFISRATRILNRGGQSRATENGDTPDSFNINIKINLIDLSVKNGAQTECLIV